MRDQRRRDLMTRSQRAVRWLQPGLVVKRWLLTSGLGLLMASPQLVAGLGLFVTGLGPKLLSVLCLFVAGWG